MVSPPRKQLYINRKMNFKISAIPWFRLNFKLFYDREKEPRSDAVAVPPPAPLSSVWLFIWIKKLDRERFYLQRVVARFSANIIWLLVYLFVGSPCLRIVLKWRQPRRVGEAGKRNFGVWDGSLPRENCCIINRKVKFKIFAIPWFSLKFLVFLWPGEGTALTRRRGSSPRAPLFLPATKFLALGEPER